MASGREQLEDKWGDDTAHNENVKGLRTSSAILQTIPLLQNCDGYSSLKDLMEELFHEWLFH